MSMIKIRAALERRLTTVAPAVDTVWENTPYVPRPDAPYQRANLLSAETVNPTYGDNMCREQGFFQVTLCYPQRVGTATIAAHAEAVRTAFPRGAALVCDDVIVHVERTPTVLPAMIDADRFCIVVRIRYYANVVRALL